MGARLRSRWASCRGLIIMAESLARLYRRHVGYLSLAVRHSRTYMNSILQVKASFSSAAVLRRILQLFHPHSYPVLF